MPPMQTPRIFQKSDAPSWGEVRRQATSTLAAMQLAANEVQSTTVQFRHTAHAVRDAAEEHRDLAHLLFTVVFAVTAGWALGTIIGAGVKLLRSGGVDLSP